MLVLSRKPGERLKIGMDVWVTVVEMRRGHVRIGIDAPDSVKILREELDLPETEEMQQQPPAA